MYIGTHRGRRLRRTPVFAVLSRGVLRPRCQRAARIHSRCTGTLWRAPLRLGHLFLRLGCVPVAAGTGQGLHGHRTRLEAPGPSSVQFSRVSNKNGPLRPPNGKSRHSMATKPSKSGMDFSISSKSCAKSLHLLTFRIRSLSDHVRQPV